MAFKKSIPRKYLRKLAAKKNAARRAAIMKKIGGVPHQHTCKRARVGQTTTTPLALATRALNVLDVLEIPKQTTEQINMRDRDIANIRGVRIMLYLQNNLVVPTEVLFVNVALVMTKATNAAPTEANLFRSYGINRSISLATSNPFLVNCYHPLNTDLYDVLMHKHIKLGAASNTVNHSLNSNAVFKKYIPIKRQVSYDNVTNSSTGKGLYLLMWCDADTGVVGTPVTPNACSVARDCIIHFRDPK